MRMVLVSLLYTTHLTKLDQGINECVGYKRSGTSFPSSNPSSVEV